MKSLSARLSKAELALEKLAQKPPHQSLQQSFALVPLNELECLQPFVGPRLCQVDDQRQLELTLVEFASEALADDLGLALEVEQVVLDLERHAERQPERAQRRRDGVAPRRQHPPTREAVLRRMI